MRRVLLLLVVCACAMACSAQGGAPANEETQTSHFSVNASAVGFAGPGSTSAASIVGGSLAITKRVALGYEQVIAPSVDATYYLGTVNYTLPLRALVGKKINDKLVFNSAKWSNTFFAGVGVIRQDLTGTVQQHLATTVGTGLNYVADNHITIQVVSAQWLHAAVHGPGRDMFVVTPNTTAIASGLKLSF